MGVFYIQQRKYLPKGIDDMTIKKYYTKNSFEQAVKLYKAEGHIFKGYTWNCAIFEDIILTRCY